MELFTPKLELGYARKQFYETGDLQVVKKKHRHSVLLLDMCLSESEYQN